MLRIISRESPLAKLQVEEFKTLLPHLDIETVFVKSLGDQDLKTSLMDSSVSADFFTRELDRAVLDGEVDLAVHSAKDLPYPLPEGLEVIALTKAGDKTDSLVARDGYTLDTLPRGAKLGTSSISRKEQILEIRPDVEIVSIRGSIGQRLEYIDRGECDAVIVATCALIRLGLENHISERLPFTTHDLQGNLAVVAKSDRFDLKELVKLIDWSRSFGTVTLVGAGPGDPELLTVKAVKALNNANIIFYDALSGTAILEDYSAEKIAVGKRKGAHSVPQEKTNRLVYEAALQGKNVVRLKAGDPLLFARGGEEIHFLQERFVPVAVVPGISSYQAGAASLNVPLTERDISREFSAWTATTENDAARGNNQKTEAIFMGATKLPEVQAELRRRGYSDTAPVAILHNIGHPSETHDHGTVGTITDLSPKTPALILVGEVLRKRVQTKPVLYVGIDPTRIETKEPIVHYPMIETKSLNLQLDTSEYDGLVFTSRTAVKAYLARNKIEKNQILFAVGSHTEEILLDKGYEVSVVPEIFDAEHLAPLIKESTCRNVLYPCSSLSDNAIHDLETVTSVVCYETVHRTEMEVDLNRVGAVMFSSPSTVDAFFAVVDQLPEHLWFYVFGKSSEERLKKMVPEERILQYQL